MDNIILALVFLTIGVLVVLVLIKAWKYAVRWKL